MFRLKMTVQEKCNVVDEVSKDIISDLPSNILARILESMPLRDAVRTSVLSTGWRNYWTAIQELVFDDEFSASVKESKFVKVIDEVLLLHNRQILKFILWVPKLCKSYHDMDRWIIYLSRNGVKELALDNSAKNPYGWNLQTNPHKLPSFLFSCLGLTHLKLSNYILKPPPTFRGFYHLNSLEISDIIFDANAFAAETLFSSSMHLERLSMLRCRGIDHLNVHTPNLTYLHLEGGLVGFIAISFRSSSTLNSFGAIKSNFVKTLGCLTRLEKLILDNSYLNDFAAGGVPTSLQTILNHLKYLELYSLDFGNTDQISSSLCLIRSSPNLLELVISAASSVLSAIRPVWMSLVSQNCSDCTLNQLRVVTMQGIDGSESQLEFIKYLLASSPKVELIYIRSSLFIDEKSALSLSTNLLKFRRASPKAEIIFSM